MSDVTRDEFDRLADRVTRMVQLMGRVQEMGVQHNRKVDALLTHFHIDPDGPVE
jgi:hypothetical protein